MKNYKAEVAFSLRWEALVLAALIVKCHPSYLQHKEVQTIWLDFIAEDRLLKAATSKMMTKNRDGNTS